MKGDFLVAFSVVTLLMWLLATLLIIPKSIEWYFRWKKSGKTMDLSIAVSAAILAFFFLSGVFVVFIKIIVKWVGHV